MELNLVKDNQNRFSSVYIVGQLVAITPLRFFAVGILFPLLFYSLAKRIPYGKFLALGETEAGYRTGVAYKQLTNSR